MTSVLVTGGTGYTGRHIVTELADHGHTVVSFNRDYTESNREGVIAEQGELYDIPRILDVLQRHDVDVIVHTAAMSNPLFSLDFPLGTFAANVEGTVALFEAARIFGRVRRIVNFSSETVYGVNPSPHIDENQPVNPSTPYAVTKVAGEWLGRVYKQRWGIDVISLRVAQVYGPGNRMGETVQVLMQGLARTNAYAIDHGAEHRYNLIYCKDVALAARAAAEAPDVATRPLAYNVSSDEYWSLGEVADAASALYPDSTVEIGPGLEPLLDHQGQFRTGSAADELGYRSAWPLARALPDYREWLLDHDA